MIKIDPPLVLTVTAVLAVGVPYLLWKIPVVGRWMPLTVTQILFGLLLGPSILGGIIGLDNHKAFFGGANLGAINAVAIVAVILFAFLAGVGTDRDVVKRSAGLTVTTGMVSLLAPLALGTLVAMGIAAVYPSAKVDGVSGLVYGLGFGLVMSITALPVLAAILSELRLMSKPIASIALAGAGVGNAFIWVGLGIVIVLAQANAMGGIGSALLVALIGAAAIAALWLLVARPIMNRMSAGPGSMGTILAATMVFAFISGGIAHVTKLHFILGAFVGGLLVPEHLRQPIRDMLERPVNVALVPFFFTVAGLATEFKLGDPTLYIVAVAGLLVAILGKIVPTALAARACGETMAFGATLGIMHMTKGLVGVALAFALSTGGVFGPSSYTAAIIVCLVTTALTAPMLTWAANASPEIRDLVTPPPETVGSSEEMPRTPASVAVPAAAPAAIGTI